MLMTEPKIRQGDPMTPDQYERLLSSRAATVRYHVGHIRTLHQAAETALLIGDLVTVKMCLSDSARHLRELEETCSR
jgi:hypothetical protein